LKLFGKELELLILDVDGVLLDIQKTFKKNFIEAAQKMGLCEKPIKKYITELSLGINHGVANFTQTIKIIWPNLNDLEVHRFKKIFFRKEVENPTSAIYGSLITVNMFSRLIPVALCTSNGLPELKQKLKRTRFNINQFSYISSQESGHPKPDPRALTIITDSLEIPKENTLFVGDWYPDWECAKAAGIPFVAVLSGGIPEYAFIREGIPKDHIVESLFNITKIIEP